MSTPLTSWKEIAQHMNKSVRTVQRWEAEYGLPIRRPEKTDPGTVLALPEELDLWLQQHTVVHAVQELAHEVTAIARHPHIGGYMDRMKTRTDRGHEVRERSHVLLNRTEQLLGKVQQQMARLKAAVDEGARLRQQTAELAEADGNRRKGPRLAS